MTGFCVGHSVLITLLIFNFFGLNKASAVSQPPCPASDNLDYVYDSNSQTCSVGDYKYAIQIKPGGVAIVGVPGANGNWNCSRISNSGTDTFFIPGGGANDGTSAGEHAKTDFNQYCAVDDSHGSGTLQGNLKLFCERNVKCDLCAQDASGTDKLASTPIESQIQSYGLTALCTQPSNSFSIPTITNGSWTWSCSTPAGLKTYCTAPVATVPTPTPVNAQCGSNIAAFDISAPPADSVLCSAGTLAPSSLKNAGPQNTWSCNGVHGGTNATSCIATSLDPYLCNPNNPTHTNYTELSASYSPHNNHGVLEIDCAELAFSISGITNLSSVEKQMGKITYLCVPNNTMAFVSACLQNPIKYGIVP